MFKSFKRWLGGDPTNAVEVLIHLYAISVALLVLLHYNFNGPKTKISHIIGNNVALLIYGVVLMGLGLVGLWAHFRKTMTHRYRARIIVLFSLFLIFFYFVLGKILIFSFSSFTWLPTLFISLCAAATYLGVRWEAR